LVGVGSGTPIPKAELQKAKIPLWKGILLVAGILQVVPPYVELIAGAVWQVAGQDAAGIELPTAAGQEVLAEHCWKATEL
jgi:hypothetical protein